MHAPRCAIAVGAITALGAIAPFGAGLASAGQVPFTAPTPVNACRTLGAPGKYVLTANLGPVPGTCLVISAPHVTLDLAGHTLLGLKAPASSGVLITPAAISARVGSSAPGAVVAKFADGIQDRANGAIITARPCRGR